MLHDHIMAILQEDPEEFESVDDIYEPILEQLEGLTEAQLPTVALPHGGPAAGAKESVKVGRAAALCL